MTRPWREQPYYDLLKQTYFWAQYSCMSFRGQGAGDDRTGLQFAVAASFIYAMKGSGELSPRPNPEVDPQCDRDPVGKPY